MERRWDAGCVTLLGSAAHALLALQMWSTRHVLFKEAPWPARVVRIALTASIVLAAARSREGCGPFLELLERQKFRGSKRFSQAPEDAPELAAQLCTALVPGPMIRSFVAALAGQGFSQAAEDALELAAQLQTHGCAPEALRKYEDARLDRAKMVAEGEQASGVIMIWEEPRCQSLVFFPFSAPNAHVDICFDCAGRCQWRGCVQTIDGCYTLSFSHLRRPPAACRWICERSFQTATVPSQRRFAPPCVCHESATAPMLSQRKHSPTHTS